MPLWHGGASFGYIPKSGIAGFSGRSISNFLRNLLNDLQSGSISLQSNQQWRSVPISPHSLQHMLSVVVLISAWNLRVVLICISLISKDFEHSAIMYASSLFCVDVTWRMYLPGFLVFLLY